jgi:RNA polymerase sigma-70 factor (ECF subfamily)
MSTETPSETNPVPAGRQDELAVAAVRGGKAERYRELVERYERRVYAVAWSRLGDAAMAEEAAQETFVRAYRRLALLGEGAKFGAWISAIARHVAISLGLRHRRELDRRERWLLEQPQVADAPGGAETERGEILREALAGLPENQRECLVLFYFEGKSTAEAAEALGISEAALRVRLHRARAALREKLEESLGESLRELRPGKSVAPGVMAVVLSSSTAKTAGGVGVGAGILAWLGKVLPVKVAAGFAGGVGVVGSLLAAFWPILALPLVMLMQMKAKESNFRDPKDFRIRLRRKANRNVLWIFMILMIAWILPLFIIGKYAPDGGPAVLALCSILFVGMVINEVLKLWRNRNLRDFVGNMRPIMTYGCILSVGLKLDLRWFLGGSFVTFLLYVARGAMAKNPVERAAEVGNRGDENLFLRAAEGLLEKAPIQVGAGEEPRPATEAEARKFAGFLQERSLGWQLRKVDEGWIVELPEVGTHRLFRRRQRENSQITLKWDETIAARLSDEDEVALRALKPEGLPVRAMLEEQVSRAVEEAWRSYRQGEEMAAEKQLGQVPLDEIFIPLSEDPLHRAAAAIRADIKALGDESSQPMYKRMLVAAGLVGVLVVVVWIVGSFSG